MPQRSWYGTDLEPFNIPWSALGGSRDLKYVQDNKDLEQGMIRENNNMRTEHTSNFTLSRSRG